MKKRIVLLVTMVITALSLQAADSDYIEKNLVLTIGQTYKEHFGYSFKPVSNSNGYVAGYYTDNNNYVIVGISRGKSLITIEADYKKYHYHVQVIDVVDVTIPRFISLPVGDTYKFSPIFHDTGVTAPLTWQSADENVVTVAEDGTVSAVGIGKAVIICSTDNGITAQCLIEVRKDRSNSRAACDTNGDGDVNSADIVEVVNVIMDTEQEDNK